MQPTRREAIKAAGAAGALAVLGGHAAAEEHDPDEPSGDEMPEETPTADQAAVSVAHLSPDAPNVDVYVDDEAVLEDAAYGDISQYLVVDAGTRSVRITAADDPDTVAFEGDVTLESTYYTVAAIGELDQETFRPLVLEDYNAAQVRLVHASPDAPAVDVTVEGTNLTLFDDVAFGENSGYVAVPPGAYTLEVRAAHPHDVGDVVGTFDVTLEAGSAYSGYATGYLDQEATEEDRPLDLQLVLDGVSVLADFDDEIPEDEADIRENDVDDDHEPPEDDDHESPEDDDGDGENDNS